MGGRRNTANVNVSTKDKLLDTSSVDSTISNNNLNHPKSLLTTPPCLEDTKFISLDSRRQSLSSGTEVIYPLTPNICVEGGRIEFIRSPIDSTNYVEGGCIEFSRSPTESANYIPYSSYSTLSHVQQEQGDVEENGNCVEERGNDEEEEEGVKRRGNEDNRRENNCDDYANKTTSIKIKMTDR
ncbi:hypothetical protein WDU94_003066 [Cyamophila willieti]